MKMIFATIVILFFNSCSNLGNDRFVRKEIVYDDITISWFYYSLITNNTTDFIEVSKGERSQIVFEAVDAISNVEIINDTIKIELYKPERGIIHTDKLIRKIYNYPIQYDTTDNYNSYTSVPDGIKEQ